jgi:hypothetical protein
MDPCMKRTFAALCIAFRVLAQADAAEPRAPTDAEIRHRQAIGRALVAPNGRFFVYEWMRPYGWVRDTGSLPKHAVERMQTWLYRVEAGRTPPTSEYVFFPGMSASYWLGAFSPDASKLSFYELDNDNRLLKTGIVELTDPANPRLVWFDAEPDGDKLNQPPVWLSNDELVYPAKSGMVRAKWLSSAAKENSSAGPQLEGLPLKAELCAECATLVAQAKAAQEAEANAKMDKEARRKAARPPEDARMLAQSPDAALTVFERSTKKAVAVLFRKGVESPEIEVFENQRVLPPWSPMKATDKERNEGAQAK